MTNYIETPAGEAFIATAESRETSREIMEAIAFFARNDAEAAALWEGDGIGTVADLTDVWERATGNGLIDDAGLMWGGRSLAEIMAQ